MRLSLFLCFLGLVLSVALPSPTPLLAIQDDASAGPIQPSQDPWYSAPSEFESASPGTTLRIRPAPGNLTAIMGGNCSSAFQILYRTTDAQGQPSWAVTTILLPVSEPSGAQNASSLLSYQIYYDSANVDDSPSYSLYYPQNVGFHLNDIQKALGSGWYVNVPDFEGPLASFTAGLQAGYATLDSIRASASVDLGPTGLSPNPLCVLWGYSGGALASEWAAELQGQYAPELNFVGAALGGLTPNIMNVISAVNGGIFAFLIPEGIMGMTSQFPQVYQYIASRLNGTGPKNSTAFMSVRNITEAQATASFQNQSIYDYFIGGSADIHESPLVQQYLDTQGLMGYHGVPQMPLFVYKAINDEVSPIADTDSLVSEYCMKGANIWYQRNTVGGHSAEETNGRSAAFDWLNFQLGGNNYTQACLIQNSTITNSSTPL